MTSEEQLAGELQAWQQFAPDAATEQMTSEEQLAGNGSSDAASDEQQVGADDPWAQAWQQNRCMRCGGPGATGKLVILCEDCKAFLAAADGAAAAAVDPIADVAASSATPSDVSMPVAPVTVNRGTPRHPPRFSFEVANPAPKSPPPPMQVSPSPSTSESDRAALGMDTRAWKMPPEFRGPTFGAAPRTPPKATAEPAEPAEPEWSEESSPWGESAPSAAPGVKAAPPASSAPALRPLPPATPPPVAASSAPTRPAPPPPSTPPPAELLRAPTRPAPPPPADLVRAPTRPAPPPPADLVRQPTDHVVGWVARVLPELGGKNAHNFVAILRMSGINPQEDFAGALAETIPMAPGRGQAYYRVFVKEGRGWQRATHVSPHPHAQYWHGGHGTTDAGLVGILQQRQLRNFQFAGVYGLLTKDALDAAWGADAMRQVMEKVAQGPKN